MPSIHSLFDESLTFERRVEKVITFSNRAEHILEGEARDYVLTENLTDEYERLLTYFEDAQSGDGAPECCVWLSGFYGSGKSSFAKYFGLAFDPQCKVKGQDFHELFTARFESKPLQQRIRTLTKKYDTAVFLLDLAAQGVASAGTTAISTLLFDRVCAWAGYPAERKVADLLARLELDDKRDEFIQKLEKQTGQPYKDLVGKPTLLIPVASALAHEYYPNIWSSPEAFLAVQSVSSVNDQELTKQILDLIEKRTGTRRVLFVVDEVGHHLRNNESLISNLDGLARNLKEVGEGRAWLIATAQQTIPKTGPLFGLQDRFPIKIDLKASDIREITHKRLLKKAPAGAKKLRESYQAKLVHSTKLTGCDGYPTLDEDSFVDFYPLLPQQFELLIHAISSLAKAHGGVGLRSAIRCIEEILINPGNSSDRFIDGELGALITTCDLYTILEKDLVANTREITLHVDNVAQTFGADSTETKVAKTVAVLQQIDDFPSSRENIAALLHDHVDGQPQLDTVNQAVDTLLQQTMIPIGETDARVSFLSEAVSQVGKERGNIITTSTDRDLIQSSILKELFTKLPSTSLEQTKSVNAGIALFDGHRATDVNGGERDIQYLIRLVEETHLADTRNALIQESLGSKNQSKVYLAATLPSGLRTKLEEIHRCDEIARLHQNHPDSEVIRFLDGQQQMSTRIRIEVQEALRQQLHNGWVTFRGQESALETSGADLERALRGKLSDVASTVFSDFKKAPVNVKSNVAEAFLKTKDISQITSERDPVGLVAVKGTDTEVNLTHPALVAILDFLQRSPNPDGKRVLDEFTRPSFGWTKDTTRYLLAALFYAQKIKLMVGGAELTVVGEQSINAFKNNTSFNKVTIKQNLEEEPPEVRQAAAKRLAELTGEQVLALPQRIADVATEYLPKFQSEVQGLPLQVAPLGIDTDRLERLQRSLTQALMGDGAEATPLFGAEQSELYEDLRWARALNKSLNQGAESLLRDIAKLRQDFANMASLQVHPKLQEVFAKESGSLVEQVEAASFVDDLPSLQKEFDRIQILVNEHCEKDAQEQQSQLKTQAHQLTASAAFQSLNDEQKTVLQAEIDQSLPKIEATVSGLQRAPTLVNQTLRELNRVREKAEAASSPATTAPAEAPTSAQVTNEGDGESLVLPPSLGSPEDLDSVLGQLEGCRSTLEKGAPVMLAISTMGSYPKQKAEKGNA